MTNLENKKRLIFELLKKSTACFNYKPDTEQLTIYAQKLVNFDLSLIAEAMDYLMSNSNQWPSLKAIFDEIKSHIDIGFCRNKILNICSSQSVMIKLPDHVWDSLTAYEQHFLLKFSRRDIVEMNEIKLNKIFSEYESNLEDVAMERMQNNNKLLVMKNKKLIS